MRVHRPLTFESHSKPVLEASDEPLSMLLPSITFVQQGIFADSVSMPTPPMSDTIDTVSIPPDTQCTGLLWRTS